jgi:hypothetical protein
MKFLNRVISGFPMKKTIREVLSSFNLAPGKILAENLKLFLNLEMDEKGRSIKSVRLKPKLKERQNYSSRIGTFSKSLLERARKNITSFEAAPY